MYEFHGNRPSQVIRPGGMLSYASAAGANLRGIDRGRLAHVGPTTVLAGMLAMDAVAGFAVPVLTAAQLSAPLAGCGPVILLTAALTLCLIGLSGGYSPRLLQRRSEQVRLVLTASVTAIGATGLAAWAFDGGPLVDLDWAFPATGLGVLSLAGGRATAGWLLARQRTGLYAPRTVVVGGGPTGARLMQALLAGEERVRLLGYIDDRPAPARRGLVAPAFLGGLAQLLALIRDGGVDRVIIALPWSAQAPVLDLIGQLAECPVQIQMARDPGIEFAADRRPPDRKPSDRRPSGRASMQAGLIHVMDPPLCGLASLVKRSEDIAIASIVLLACLPFMAAIALAIRLDSPGPVLFRQQRTGYNNRDFQMLKFRTMHHHLADPAAQRQVTRSDPRVTRTGVWLRRSSLDELPQIINVLRGEMSIVGPRPHAPGTRAGGRVFDQVVGHYAARHRVRPGVTGLAQVRGLRGPTETEDKLVSRVDADLEYIENWSLWLDLLVLARTAFAVLRMKNAC